VGHRFKESPPPHDGRQGPVGARVKETDYLYSISSCGPLRRSHHQDRPGVADGTLIDLSAYTTRLSGDEAQTGDPAIEDTEGEGNTPLIAHLYVVFEDMRWPLGNRIPQLQFEVIRAISSGNPRRWRTSSAVCADSGRANSSTPRMWSAKTTAREPRPAERHNARRDRSESLA